MARDGERGRGDWKARRGSRNSGPYAEASGDTGPVDIAAVRRDDALIDAIASDGPVPTDSAEEYQLATLLASWRAELLSEPLPSDPDLDEIVAAVNQEIGARKVRVGAQAKGRLRLLRPILGAAAALALVIGGLMAFSYNSSPGDPLWGVKQVVFSEQAQSTVVQRANDDMTAAAALLNSPNPSQQDVQQAKAKLEQARSNATAVNDTGKQDQLAEQFNRLLERLKSVAKDTNIRIPEITTAPHPSDKPINSGSTTLPVTPNPAVDGTTSNPVKPTTSSGSEPTGTGTGSGTSTGSEPSTIGNPTTAPVTVPPTSAVEPTSVPSRPTVVPTTVASPTVVEPTADGNPITRPHVNPGTPGKAPGTR
ncbi:anti-sigma-D factor RsdA [Nocardia arthritidis]|uniref:Anti-sigma-D factor RsdA sigma factor binding region domain-containing protein n=1 Tax=Nocardia arthritidis TaxID=228602 RepID=A0A6G9Y7A4_9NOCA|nr:anti-sigma-D factor RsdA [Nocardia arthritidis]QIS09101.1 hypothetical protein F5544_05950 [Nocardia arthritidis]